MREREYVVRVAPFTPPQALAAAATASASTAEPERDADHSPDWSSVRWFGREHTFNPTQAAIVAVLWQAWARGTPDVHGRTLLREADSFAEDVRDVFRGHAAWGSMVMRSSRHGGPAGCFRLVK